MQNNNNPQVEDNDNTTLVKLMEKLDKQGKEINEQGKLLNGIIERLSRLEGLTNRVVTPRRRR